MAIAADMRCHDLQRAEHLRALAFRLLPVALLVMLSSACAPLQTSTGAPAPIESRQPGKIRPVEKADESPAKKIAPARQAVSPAQKAVSSLLQQGWGYYRVGNYERSIAIAERAQRLDSQRAEIYLLLAKSYFAQGKSEVAEQLSQRGLSFSQSDVVIRRQLQDLLAQIRGAVF